MPTTNNKNSKSPRIGTKLAEKAEKEETIPGSMLTTTTNQKVVSSEANAQTEDEIAVDTNTQEKIRAVLNSVKAKQSEVEEQLQEELPQQDLPLSAIAQSAKSEIETAVAEQAEALVEAENQARQTYTEAGITKGLKAAGVIRQGFQIGLLTGLTEATKTDAKELVEQLELLDLHIDAESTDSTKNLLEQLGVSKPKPKEADEELPFRSEAIAKNAIQSQGKFNILNKGVKK